MSFNGGMEDTQNWPFSVRYTASPYRKAINGSGTTGREISSGPGPNHNLNSRYNNANNLSMTNPMTNSLRPSLINSTPTGLGTPITQYNPNVGSEFNFRPVVDNQYHYHPQEHTAMQGNLYYNSHKQYFVPDHHHYGLPLPLPSQQTTANNHLFLKQPPQFSQDFTFVPDKAPINFHVNGLLDEGYIEDLKQTNCNNIPNEGYGNEFVGRSDEDGNNVKQLEYDPYSYVYDSKIQEDLSGSQLIQRHQPELVSGISSPPLNTPPHGFNAFGGDKSNSRSASGSSENEYEEIRDVARYINQGPSGPYHFKSFSSTDDILAEVVQVQQRHDRVLDQLNLEVENLLIRSTTEIEERSKSYENELGKLSDLRPLPSRLHYIPKTVVKAPINSHCFCNDQKVKSLSQSGDLNSYCRSDVIRNGCSCGNELSGSNTLPYSCKSESDHLKNHECNLQRNSIPRHDFFQQHTISNGNILQNNSANVSSSIPTNTSTYNSIGSTSRKKKLDRSLTTDTNFKSSIGTEQSVLPLNGGKEVKVRYQRSYSLIPHWKIREHLKRLPFLNKQDKSKKLEIPAERTRLNSNSQVETLSATTHPPSTSFQEFPKHISSQCMDENKIITAQLPVVGAATKPRSSSMDELRVTATEEHWYSADSDTEPDSLTELVVPSEINGELLTSAQSRLENRLGATKTIDDDVDITFNSHSHSPNINHINSISQPSDSGPIFDIRNGIPDVPKAPKFRRGSGFKEKWRDSWNHSKSLSKNSMDEDSRLTRWFSLRKNHGSINEESGNNRHSTLPQLSEEDMKRISFIEEEEGYWPRRQVQPPSLPPPPSDLTPEQVTRRHIVAAVVHSENSYVAALQRLVNEYKKPLECSHPAILSHSKISTIFHRVPEILQCHSLFRIALAECVRRWDADEKIGDVFVASFSKSLVLDVYSEFINNFGQAMETAKLEARRKSAFADFLKVKQMTAHDRLSLFGLMVKPVQRFPQFILLLQDLLKHTPKEHHDRMSLQLALTQLESLAAMLNERKRESEQYQAFRETIKSISGGKFVLLRTVIDDPNRILLRQDVVTQLDFDGNSGSVTKSKCRKLLLLNDMLICVGLNQHGSTSNDNGKGGDAIASVHNAHSKMEKSVFKWSYPVKDVEVEDISISPTMSRFVQNGGNKSSNLKAEEGNFASLSLLEEMQSLMYDYEVLSRVLTLVSSLKSSYEGLTESSVKELMMEIQLQIRCRDEQISYFDSSCLTLLVGSGNNREKIVFQMQSPSVRNDWVEELRLSQLALDTNNSPAWDIPHESPYPLHKLPLFVRALSLSKSPYMTTVKCGCYFTHTFVSPTGRSKILDYLWVSSSDGISSHVTAFKSQQNTLKEVSSFDLVEEKINAFLFVLGRVWVATDSRKVMLYDPAHPEGGSNIQCILSDSVLKLTLFGNNIYAGLADGNLAVFTQIKEPKVLAPEIVIQIGSEKITSVFGSREHIYASCGNSVVTIDAKTHIIQRNVTLTHHSGSISHMTCSGVGLWITTQDSETVCLYHLETLQHLQDVSIAPSVFRTVRDSFRRQKGCHVTCLTAHKGWLWIGTNLGVVLTIPLPRLEGVPIISTGKANVSYHGFCGPVTFLMPLTKQPIFSLPTTSRENNSGHGNKDSEVKSALDTRNTPHVEEVKENVEQTTSTPNTTKEHAENKADLHPKFSTPEEKMVNGTSETEPHEIDSPITTPVGNNSSTNSHIPVSAKISDGSLSENSALSKTLVVLRKKNSKDNVFMRNCKTLPRGGTIPSRFSIDSDVYGLYGNLINVRGLEDEGRFVDPLYDALRRSDPELVNLDVKINTLDRRMKMRMSRPRSLDLSNWSVDSKFSASSDESVGIVSRNSQIGDSMLMTSTSNGSVRATTGAIPSIPEVAQSEHKHIHSTPTTTNKANKTIARQQYKNKEPQDRTVVVVVGGRGYINMKTPTPFNQDHFSAVSNNIEFDSKLSTYLNVWQMKT